MTRTRRGPDGSARTRPLPFRRRESNRSPRRKSSSPTRGRSVKPQSFCGRLPCAAGFLWTKWKDGETDATPATVFRWPWEEGKPICDFGDFAFPCTAMKFPSSSRRRRGEPKMTTTTEPISKTSSTRRPTAAAAAATTTTTTMPSQRTASATSATATSGTATAMPRSTTTSDFLSIRASRIGEEDLAIRAYNAAWEDGEDGGGRDAADVRVGGDRASEPADERPSPSPSPAPTVGSKAEEIDEEAFRWWRDFDYNFSESVGIDVDEEDPAPARCEKRTRESAQEAGPERKAALRLDCERDAPEEEEAREEGGSLPRPDEARAQARPLPGPSRKRSRDEAGLDRETRRTKRLCRRSECDAETSEDSLSGAAARLAPPRKRSETADGPDADSA